MPKRFHCSNSVILFHRLQNQFVFVAANLFYNYHTLLIIPRCLICTALTWHIHSACCTFHFATIYLFILYISCKPCNGPSKSHVQKIGFLELRYVLTGLATAFACGTRGTWHSEQNTIYSFSRLSLLYHTSSNNKFTFKYLLRFCVIIAISSERVIYVALTSHLLIVKGDVLPRKLYWFVVATSEYRQSVLF